MAGEAVEPMTTAVQSRWSGWKIFFLVVAVAVVTSALTVWIVTAYLFPKQFEPVQLSDRESQTLAAKLQRLDPAGRAAGTEAGGADAAAPSPEPYREDPGRREVSFSERELNALVARNTDLARKLAIDLSDNLASARLLVPLDPDFPILGGQTLKLSAGLELGYAEGHPVVVLRGVSLWGVPVPNAWLGGIKNVDLVREFSADGGFWDAFSKGVDYIRVEDGRLTVKLKE